LSKPVFEVKLARNGGYWQAWYFAPDGRRQRVGLGNIAKISRRQASKRCVELANELANNPALANAGQVPELGAYLDKYLAGRADLKPGSLYSFELTGRYLRAYFGERLRLDKVTRATARDWRTALQAGAIVLPRQPGKSGGRPRGATGAVGETTVCNLTKYAKAFFAQAVEDDLIPLNPFGKLKSHASNPQRDWHYLTADDLEKLLAACPSHGWKAMLALCRLAGLRRGEAVALPWSGVDWDGRKLTVYATKTAKTSGNGGKRVVPIEPRLYDVLLAAFDAAGEGASRVCDVSTVNLNRDFEVVRTRAGLDAFAEPFQIMRRTRETSWAQQYPQGAVSEWLGHDITVSQQFYLKVPEELYAKVSGGQLPQNLPQSEEAGV
jgi:integrase